MQSSSGHVEPIVILGRGSSRLDGGAALANTTEELAPSRWSNQNFCRIRESRHVPSWRGDHPYREFGGARRAANWGPGHIRPKRRRYWLSSGVPEQRFGNL